MEANMAKRENLEKKVATFSKLLGRRLVVDFAACYGGYAIESEDGKLRLTNRMPLNQAICWVDGAIEGLELYHRLNVRKGLDELVAEAEEAANATA
jgi:hypothetical protein